MHQTGWGIYDAVADRIVFLLFMVAWNLLALDAVQQVKRLRKRQKREAQWKSSSRY